MYIKSCYILLLHINRLNFRLNENLKTFHYKDKNIEHIPNIIFNTLYILSIILCKNTVNEISIY